MLDATELREGGHLDMRLLRGPKSEAPCTSQCIDVAKLGSVSANGRVEQPHRCTTNAESSLRPTKAPQSLQWFAASVTAALWAFGSFLNGALQAEREAPQERLH